MGSFYLTCGVFVFGVLGLITYLAGFSIFRFISYIKEELLIVLGAGSSESALPALMRKLEKLGCSNGSSPWWYQPATRSTWTAPTST